jgi:glycogen debranching enzyme
LTDIVRLEDEYYVRASSALADDRTRVLKYGDTFAVFNRYGDIEPLGTSSFGLFHAETRYLSRLTLRLNHKQPMLLSSTIRDDNAFLSVDLTNVDTNLNGNGQLARGTVHVFRLLFLRDAACYQYIRVLNYGLQPVKVTLLLQFEADFADIFEVRGTKRTRRGERLADHVSNGKLVLPYRGLDGVLRRTCIEFSPSPVSLSAQEAMFEITLQAKEESGLSCTVACERNSPAASVDPYNSAFRKMEQEFDSIGIDECVITTSSDTFNAWLTRSSADLRMLIDGNPEGPYPYAGVPWFNTVFGRDGIITALECLWMTPRLAESVLKYLAETQATREDPERDAEPGKIIHEMRRGEMSVMGEVPFARYYGSVDSTPLFVMLAGAYFLRTHRLSFLKEIWPHIKLAIEWIDTYGDPDKDGFVEYQKRSSKGLVQQGWKDSHDSIFHADGRMAEPPIALCEVQAYVYAAKRSAALIAHAFQETEFAERLETQAAALREKFDQAFWCEELGMYALALDGEKNQCRVRTSNAGHALFCRIAREERAKSVVSSLMTEQLFSGWGVRTVGSAESRYNPMSYHNGSVWPHDNALLGLGFSLYGFQHYACDLLHALFEVSRDVELQRLPELFCGFHKRPGTNGPTLYPVACAPQAWAAGAVFLLLRACLGMNVRAPERQICFDHPLLPRHVDQVRIENLTLVDSTVDLLIHHQDQAVAVEVLRRRGEIEILKSL